MTHKEDVNAWLALSQHRQKKGQCNSAKETIQARSGGVEPASWKKMCTWPVISSETEQEHFIITEVLYKYVQISLKLNLEETCFENSVVKLNHKKNSLDTVS